MSHRRRSMHNFLKMKIQNSNEFIPASFSANFIASYFIGCHKERTCTRRTRIESIVNE